MVITQRVYRTNDGRFVGEGHPDAAFLAYPAGTEVADNLVAHYGLGQWVSTGRPAQRAIVVPGVNAGTTSGGPIVGDPLTTPVRGVGTIPPGHATASIPGVPAEVADPVVNADGTHRGEVTVRQPARTTTTTPAAKPTRTTREV